MILDWTIKFGDILTIISLLGMALAFTWSARSVLAKIEITDSTIGLRLKSLEGDMRAIDGKMKTLTAAMITLARQDERIKEHDQRLIDTEQRALVECRE